MPHVTLDEYLNWPFPAQPVARPQERRTKSKSSSQTRAVPKEAGDLKLNRRLLRLVRDQAFFDQLLENFDAFLLEQCPAAVIEVLSTQATEKDFVDDLSLTFRSVVTERSTDHNLKLAVFARIANFILTTFNTFAFSTCDGEGGKNIVDLRCRITIDGGRDIRNGEMGDVANVQMTTMCVFFRLSRSPVSLGSLWVF